MIPDGLGGYTHNAAIHVVDPQGRLIEIVDWANPMSPREWCWRTSVRDCASATR